MSVILVRPFMATGTLRLAWVPVFAAAVAALALALAPSAHATVFAIGQRASCEIYFKNPGTIIPFHPGETFNGYPASSGYFYRLHIDGMDPEGSLCKSEDMKPAGPVAAPPRPAAAAVAPPRTATPRAAPAALPPPPRVATPTGGAGRFGARSPFTNCPVVRSKPNMAQIMALVRCDDESKSEPNHLYLDENLAIQVGGTRRYNEFADGLATTINTGAPVLPLRASLDSYQCSPLSPYTNKGTTYDTDNTGKNCVISPMRNQRGTCYLTTLGNWLCHLNEGSQTAMDRLNQPPPR